VTVAVIAVQCALQALVAHTVSAQLWWQTDWARGRLRVSHPLAADAQRLPRPGWQSWVPSAATAVLVTLALILLALLVVRAGRGWWLLLVAALPLVPTQVAPTVWAPPPVNQLANALVWPAGATAPSTTWAWVDAVITALMVVIPAASLNATPGHRPWTSGQQVLGRLLPAGLAAGLALGCAAAEGWTPDPRQAGWRVLLVVVGALVVTGTLRLGVAVAALAVLPAFAAGGVRWTAGPDGLPTVVTDPLALWMSCAAVAGGVVALAQPALARWLQRARSSRRQMLADDAAFRSAARAAAVAASVVTARSHAAHDGGTAPADPTGSGSGPDDELAGVSRRSSHAAPARAGGRHRA
jgi:hypothetical protein